LVRDGELQPIKIGKWKFDRLDLDALIDRRKTAA